MITKVENLKVGQTFHTSPVNPYSIPFGGKVSKIETPGNYIIVTTSQGGWHRIHKGHTVTVVESSITI